MALSFAPHANFSLMINSMGAPQSLQGKYHQAWQQAPCAGLSAAAQHIAVIPEVSTMDSSVSFDSIYISCLFDVSVSHFSTLCFFHTITMSLVRIYQPPNEVMSGIPFWTKQKAPDSPALNILLKAFPSFKTLFIPQLKYKIS